MDHEIIFRYFPDLTENQRNQFIALKDQYLQWNERINVISRKDQENLYVNHVLHSLGIGKVIQFVNGSQILDVGTGGGFPGLPLAILFPDSNFHLVDSIGKKITVVKEVAQALQIKNLTTDVIRAERITDQYDFIVSRAVTRFKEFYGWVHRDIKKENRNTLHNGILYLKGGDLEDEMNEAKCPYQLFELSNYFTESFFETKKVVYVPMA